MIEKKVTIEEARELQNEGKFVDNPHYDPQKVASNDNLPKHWRCRYLVYWAPNGDIRSPNQYATVREI